MTSKSEQLQQLKERLAKTEPNSLARKVIVDMIARLEVGNESNLTAASKSSASRAKAQKTGVDSRSRTAATEPQESKQGGKKNQGSARKPTEEANATSKKPSQEKGADLAVDGRASAFMAKFGGVFPSTAGQSTVSQANSLQQGDRQGKLLRVVKQDLKQSEQNSTASPAELEQQGDRQSKSLKTTKQNLKESEQKGRKKVDSLLEVKLKQEQTKELTEERSLKSIEVVQTPQEEAQTPESTAITTEVVNISTVPATQNENSDSLEEQTSSDSEKGYFFQAIGYLEAKVSFSQKGRFPYEIEIGERTWPLFVPKGCQPPLAKQIENSPDTKLFARVYPASVINENKRRLYTSFRLITWSLTDDWTKLGLKPGEFLLAGVWQFIPQLSRPVLIIYRNRVPKKSERCEVTFLPLMWLEGPRPWHFACKGEPTFYRMKATFAADIGCFKCLELEQEWKKAPKYIAPYEPPAKEPSTENINNFKLKEASESLTRPQSKETPDAIATETELKKSVSEETEAPVE